VRRALVAATVALTLVLTPASAAQAAPSPGAPGIGDVYFPDYGNGGYDVSHYDLRLRYNPATDRLTGTATILAKATQDLSRFNLDFLLDVSSIRVNGWAATFTREGDHELVVTPARSVRANQAMTIVVMYSGTPSEVEVFGGYVAWTRTADGALAVNEPEIAWWWFPSNDHPLDKATYDISVSVPDGVEVISNGVMPRPPIRELLGWTRWIWRTTKPMQTYLAFLAIGQYQIVTDTAPNGQPVINAYSENLGDLANAARASIERTAEITEWEEGILGPYPFEAQGGVAGPLDGVGFALENQTRSVYGPGFWRRGSNPYVVVHEIAHQWFGDSVGVAQWRDIWLNEGFASYLEWLWSDYTGEGTAQEVFDFVYSLYPEDSDFWTILPADPGAANIFDAAVYDRGAMTLHQLRLAVGDPVFFRILRDWAALKQYGNATTAEFIALAEALYGQELDELFDVWLYTPSRPVLTGVQAARATAAPAEPKSWPKLRQVHEARSK